MSERRPVSSELTPLTGPVRSRRFLVLDIESKDGPSQRAGFTRPFMMGVFDGEQYSAFFNRPATHRPPLAWDVAYHAEGGCIDLAARYLLTRPFSGRYIYAHNGGRFDFLFLLPWLMGEGEKLGFKFSIIPVSSSIQVLDVWNEHHSWRFLDSYKLIPIGLNRAAKAFGMAGKLEHDLDLPETDPSWSAYNEQDCTELYEVIKRLHNYVENVLCGEVGITAPATAMKLFRRRYLKTSIPRSVESHEFIREGYYGGRVDVFETKGTKLRYYDINSSYPRAMLETMPAGKATFWCGTPPDRLTDSGQIGFVRADVSVPVDTHIPVLPVRMSQGELAGKLLFPVGHLSGVWAWDELQLAVSEGATIQKIHESYWYEPIPLYREYVIDLYKYRDKSRPGYDEGLAEVVKLLLNSTYGKNGMLTLRKKIYRYDDPKLPKDATPAYPDPECLIFYHEEEIDAPYIMPQIAARVTSLARMNLYRYMKQAISLGGKVYYCDTDSLITDVVMPTSSELGGLKDEYPEHSGRITGEFLAPKVYLLHEPVTDFRRVKAKGIQSPKVTDKTLSDAERERERQLQLEAIVRRLAAGETIYQPRLEKVGTLARSDFKRGPQLLNVPKTLDATTRAKRHIHSDGTTTPIRLRQW